MLVAQLDHDRRYSRQMRFLEDVARSSRGHDIVWNMEEVRRAIDEVTANGMRRASRPNWWRKS